MICRPDIIKSISCTYMAPELIEFTLGIEKNLSQAIDMYCFGLCLIEVCAAKLIIESN